MADLITVEKLRLLKPKVVGTDEVLAAVITAASAVLRRKRPLIDAWVADGSVDVDLVEFVVASMIERDTADRVKYETISQASFGYDTAWLESGLFPTDAELDSITPEPVGRKSKPWGPVRPSIGLAGRWRR